MPTVISSLPTAEGFVIGSDGRSCGPDGQIITEEAQKIFSLDRPAMRLAYGIFGTAKIGSDDDGVLFDFETQIPLMVERMGRSRNWWEFLASISAQLRESLDGIRSGRPDAIDHERGTFISMGGFFENHQKLGHLEVNYKAGSTEVEPHNYSPGFSYPFGSIKLFDLLNNGDPRFAKYAQPSRVGIRRLQDGVERVRQDILLHYDHEARALDASTCSHIGGRIQIATVTFAGGFSWVPGFEAATASK
jgi:hypothetical protein